VRLGGRVAGRAVERRARRAVERWARRAVERWARRAVHHAVGCAGSSLPIR
jgi:hypothetical protein